MTEYKPSHKEMMQILQSLGLHPQLHQSQESFQSRVAIFIQTNPNISTQHQAYYHQNSQLVLSTLKQKHKESSTAKLLGVGQEMWAFGILGGIIQGSVKIGLEFNRLNRGEIDIGEFAKASGKVLAVTGVRVAGCLGGAVLGAAIGAFGGPFGMMIGAGIGGIIGGIGGSVIAKVGYEWTQQKIKEMNKQKIYKKALDILELPEQFSTLHLQHAIILKSKRYHPDKWSGASTQTQDQMKLKLMEALQSYEIIKTYKGII